MDQERSPMWLPSAQLRQWMGIGAVALAIDICLSLTSLVITLVRQHEPEEFSITQLLDTSTLIPEFFVLVAFLKLARETASLGLYRSSIGFFASTWLLITFMLIDGNGEWDDIILTLLTTIGTVVMFVVVFRDRSHLPEFAEQPLEDAVVQVPDPDRQLLSAETSANRSQSSMPTGGESSGSGWGCGSAVLAGILLKALSRGLRNANFNWVPILAIGLVSILACTAIVFAIWFGLSKIRLRDKLGPIATLCGTADIVTLVVQLAALGIVLSVLLSPAMAEQEPDFHEPILLVPMVLSSVVDIAWTGLHFVMFVMIGQRITDPWSTATELEGGRRLG